MSKTRYTAQNTDGIREIAISLEYERAVTR